MLNSFIKNAIRYVKSIYKSKSELDTLLSITRNYRNEKKEFFISKPVTMREKDYEQLVQDSFSNRPLFLPCLARHKQRDITDKITKELIAYIDSDESNFEDSVHGDFIYYDWSNGHNKTFDVLKLKNGKLYIFSLYYAWATDAFLLKLNKDENGRFLLSIDELKELDHLLADFKKNVIYNLSLEQNIEIIKQLAKNRSSSKTIEIEIIRGDKTI